VVSDSCLLNSKIPECLSLIRRIEIIGASVARLTPAFRTEHRDVPWADMIGMRNRVIHAYFDVNLDIVWRTTVEELPELMERIQALAAEEDVD